MINIDPSNGLLLGATNQSFESVSTDQSDPLPDENIYNIKLQIVFEDYSHEIKDILYKANGNDTPFTKVLS